jgi:hypothetical protein
MAQTLDSTLISLGISATINNPKALQAPVQAVLNLAQSQAFTSGTGALQADRLWADTRTIAISGTDPLDLAGVLVDAVGTVMTLARVKLLYIAAAATNTNNLILGNGTNPFINWVGAAAHTVTVRPGGTFLLMAPDVTGYVVTGATGDIFQVANSGAGTTVTYNVVIMGSSV